MTRDEFEKRLEAAEKQNLGLLDEIKNLKAQLAKVQEDEIPDLPDFNINDDFYIMTEDMEVSGDAIIDPVSDYNYFHTKEYAQEFADKCKLIAMLLHCKWYLDRDYVPNWSEPLERKWQLYYDHDEKKMIVGAYSHSDYGVVFSTGELAQKAADWINKHYEVQNYD